MMAQYKANTWNSADFMPDKILKQVVGKISGECKLAFGAALFFGFLTHLFMFVNKLPNGDDLESMYRNYSMITSGRWFDMIATSLSSFYGVPWTTGVIALIFLALSVAVFCSLLQFKRHSSILITAALMTTFPVLAAQFSYLFYADLYMIAMFLGVSGLWLSKRYRWGFLPGALAIACSMGCYQAYIGFAIVVSMLSLMIEILRNKTRTREVIILTMRYLLAGFLGVSCYFIILKCCLVFFQLNLTDYQGIAHMGHLPDSIPALIGKTYSAFFAYFFQDIYFESSIFYKSIYGLVSLTGVFLLGVGIIRNRCYRSCKIIILVILLAALPIGYNFIFVMAPEAYLHCLMQPQYILFFVMPVVFFEAAFSNSADHLGSMIIEFGSSWIIVLASCLIAYNFYLLTNICYLHLDLKYEITYATELRILDRIEQSPGYSSYTPILFIGSFPNENVSLYPQATMDTVKGLIGINGNLVHRNENYYGFYSNYLGKQLRLANKEDADKILRILENETMPLWPEDGSVAMVEGVLVVNINDN